MPSLWNTLMTKKQQKTLPGPPQTEFAGSVHEDMSGPSSEYYVIMFIFGSIPTTENWNDHQLTKRVTSVFGHVMLHIYLIKFIYIWICQQDGWFRNNLKLKNGNSPCAWTYIWSVWRWQWCTVWATMSEYLSSLPFTFWWSILCMLIEYVWNCPICILRGCQSEFLLMIYFCPFT